MPGEGGHFVSKMTDFANKPWVIRTLRSLSVLMCCSYVCIPCGQGVETFKVLLSVHVGPPPSQQATGQQLYQILTFDHSFSLYLSHSAQAVDVYKMKCVCVIHTTKRHINQHKRISMTIPISLIPNESASGLHWEWQKEMQVRHMTIQKTSSKHCESFCRGEQMRRANLNETVRVNVQKQMMSIQMSNSTLRRASCFLVKSTSCSCDQWAAFTSCFVTDQPISQAK